MSAAAEEPTYVTDVLTAALGYASAGWRVVPIGPKRKFPAMEAWQDNATADPDLVRNWWTGMYKGHGVGIATGSASRLFVVDVDVSDGKHGDESLADLEAKYGALPATIEVQTGSGGRHLYFRWPAGREVRNNAGTRLGPGLDVRGEGGQVLAPPTIHPNGTPYAWVIGQEWDEHILANAPAWLIDLVCETPRPEPRSGGLELPRRDDRPGDRWSASITWKDLLEADGWTFHHTDANGEEFWTRPGKERRDGASASLFYKGADVLKVFTSSVPGLDPEGTYSRFAYLAATKHAGDFYAAAQWCAAEMTKSTLFGTAPATGPALVPDEVIDPPKSFLDRLKEHTYRGIAGLEAVPAVVWLVHPVIAEDSLFQIFAPSSAGKSFAAIDLACCVATGKPWHGRKVKRGVVVYVVAEGAAGIKDRLTAWAQFHNQTIDPTDVYVITLPAMLHRLDEASALATWCAELGAVMVIIDTYARSTLGLDENKNSEAGLAIDGLDIIRRATKAAVGVIHHTGHTGGRGRGASALYAAMDTVIAVEGDASSLSMTTSPEKGGKQKNGSDDWSITLTKESIFVGRVDEIGMKVTSLVLASDRAPRRMEEPEGGVAKTLEALRAIAVGAGATSSQWLSQAVDNGVSRPSFFRHRKKLIETGLVSLSLKGETEVYQVKCDQSHPSLTPVSLSISDQSHGLTTFRSETGETRETRQPANHPHDPADEDF